MAERRRFPWVKFILGLLVFLALIGLGTWQVERLQWKEGLLAEIEARSHAPGASLGEIEALWRDSQDVDYRTVTLSGRLLNDKERHFFTTYKGTSGYNVYTPLALEDGRTIFVNRGFVPYDRKDPATRPAGQVAGPVTITGLARNPLPGKPSSLLPDNDAASNIYYWKDLAGMAAQSGIAADRVLSFFVDANEAPNPGGLPVGGVTIIDLPNNHLQYAVTWYGLAATLLIIAAISFLRRKQTPRDGQPA